MLEAVFYRRTGVFIQKSTCCAQYDLSQQDAHQRSQRSPEAAPCPVHSHIDDAPQHERKGDAGNAQHRLHCDQNAYQKPGFSRCDADPL